MKSALPRLFHQTIEANFKGGALIANVMENYGGETAMNVAIESYSDLVFNGVMAHESVSNDGGAYYPFSGSNGEPAWRKFILSEDEEIMSPEEIQDRIIPNDQTVSISEGQQIAEIIAKLRPTQHQG